MLNKKLKAIASLIDKSDTVIDIGCDHAYLAIYLKKNNLCRSVYASDISKNVLNGAIKNIEASKVEITTYLSDGFKNINNDKINTAILSGMGTSTILSIINNSPKSITKYIISSNNDHELLRTSMHKLGFYIKSEIVINEKNKYYPIMLFTKAFQKETKKTLKYGKSNNKEYYKHLLEKEYEILKNIPKKHLYIRFKHQKKVFELKKML